MSTDLRRGPRLMEVRRYRKKPVAIEAVQLDSDNRDAVLEWVNGNGGQAIRIYASMAARPTGSILIHTLEGDMRADPGDWIIRGVKGELYPCKPDIFEATYEPALSSDHQGGRGHVDDVRERGGVAPELEEKTIPCGLCGVAKSDPHAPCSSCGKFDRPPVDEWPFEDEPPDPL